ncbi:GNAT family N-acetyltransferase [Scytonema sp. UIC 10036]|uniref:GNAT family N-acetyltransferase n=1 Tax=Scytonema sp. UIC 10036 TaxID=2304196 RepID=UPI0012DAC91E|nr:GNAT family N-acetyltransferase [Scytonema sp. UIC 10036]MUG92457.1 GNAT family N-acetyltransferase [Scytonema sp. UIC 10036]
MNIQVLDVFDPLWSKILQNLRHDFYHLPEYLALEAKRMKAVAEAMLIQDDEKIFFFPYLLRQCDDAFPEDLKASEIFDVLSPYGYPGILLNEAGVENFEFIHYAMLQVTQKFKDRRICSAFLRLHPILNNRFDEIYRLPAYKIHSETIAIDLKLTESEIWHQTRPEHRTKINKSKRYGFVAKIAPLNQYLLDFIDIYVETMARVGASPAYYFSREYFLDFVEALKQHLHLCTVELDSQVVCAGLFTECCGIVQYHLGGTRSEFLKFSPSTLMFDHVRYWAKERGNEIFHLGGGVGGAKDSLHHFKAGFSRQRYNFPLIRLITDEKTYMYLVNLRAKLLNLQVNQLLKTEFFPVYRSLSV